mmetsp:Transcript_39052/g.90413  ORF Transcript_39052/g.90413 Transcript_39052/m.90413 type:complete len:111 (-) Transcript_39052:164-496(-)
MEEPNAFRAHDIAIISWALAKMQFANEPLMANLTCAFLTVSQFHAVTLANMAWACASLRWCNIPLMRIISQRAQSMIHEFTAQHIASTTWAFAKLSVHDKSLIAAISQML